jgi:hypothetical protein
MANHADKSPSPNKLVGLITRVFRAFLSVDTIGLPYNSKNCGSK